MKSIQECLDILKQYHSQSEQAVHAQLALWEGNPKEQPLLLMCAPSDEEGEEYNTKEIHYNKEKMLANGVNAAVCACLGKAQAVPSVRANMGCGIFPTLFGMEQSLFEDKMPWMTEHLPKEKLKKMGPEDLKFSDEFKMGLEHMMYMAQKLEGTGCHVFPMDLQGPFDTAHIVYGDAIFYDLYDDPEFVHHLLELSCAAIIKGMDECLRLIPQSEKYVCHYNQLVMPRKLGGVKISEDTSTLLSKECIEEFVVPYTEKVLNHFGGGYIHYCGKNDHLFEAVMGMKQAFGLNFGNPEKHDMPAVLNRCAKEDKVFYGDIPKDDHTPLPQYFEQLLQASRNEKGSRLLLCYSCSMEERETVLSAWKDACHAAL